MKKTKHIRLNKMTSEGLLVLSAKSHKRDDTIVRLHITDFTNMGKATIDIEKEIMIGGNVPLSEHDIKMICKELKKESLSFTDKVKNAIIFD
jgi:hypothetical protein